MNFFDLKVFVLRTFSFSNDKISLYYVLGRTAHKWGGNGKLPRLGLIDLTGNPPPQVP